MVMIDKECHACSMKVQHSRHDKGLRRKNRSHYTKPQIHIDWEKNVLPRGPPREIKTKNTEGKVVKKHVVL